jgi:tetratricopeptide (TPR) repeat protein
MNTPESTKKALERAERFEKKGKFTEAGHELVQLARRDPDPEKSNGFAERAVADYTKGNKFAYAAITSLRLSKFTPGPEATKHKENAARSFGDAGMVKEEARIWIELAKKAFRTGDEKAAERYRSSIRECVEYLTGSHSFVDAAHMLLELAKVDPDQARVKLCESAAIDYLEKGGAYKEAGDLLIRMVERKLPELFDIPMKKRAAKDYDRARRPDLSAPIWKVLYISLLRASTGKGGAVFTHL